jgi:hypothetical protein
MNRTPRVIEAISTLMRSVERIEWKGYKVPGVRLSPGQEFLVVEIRSELRKLHPGEPAIAIHFPRRWVDDDPGWKFYPREELTNRWRTGGRSMDRATEGLGGK